MTREEAKEKLYRKWQGFLEDNIDYAGISDAYKIAIKALEQEPCEDAISREAVDEYITNLLSGYLYAEERTRLEDLSAFVWELPSVTPQRKIGKWIDDCGGVKCPFCGYSIGDCYYVENYCPNCGVRMESEE